MSQALLALSALLANALAWAGCDLKQMDIPVRIVDQRPIATLTLNGTAVPLLVDSGAFFSMLSESTATQLKLPLHRLPKGMSIYGYTGLIDAKLTRVENVGLLGTHLSKVEFMVGGNELEAGIQGVLGRNILALADTEYDLAHGVVRLSFPTGDCAKTNFAHWAGEAPVIELALDLGLQGKDTAVRLEVSINGKPALALLDTGARQTALTLKTARRAGIEESDLVPGGRVGGAGDGRVKSWTSRVAVFELGGEKITNSRLRIDDVDDAEVGVLIGMDYFLAHRIYVSRLQRQVYLTWNGGPSFAPAGETPGDYDPRYAALPKDVGPDDADALARRGAAAIAAKNYASALQDLNRACTLAPGVADYFYARSQLHLAMRQARPALADLDEALRLDPAHVEARMRRAWLQAALDKRASAQADLTQLDLALPPSSGLRADMAAVFASFSQAAEALRQFDLWIGSHQKDARRASMLNSRCWLRTRLNLAVQLALQDCKQAVDLDDGAAAHHDSLGWTYLRLGDAARAKSAFDDAIKLEALPFSLFGRGLAKLWLNDASGGAQDLAAARSLKPSIDEDARTAGFDFVDRKARPAVAGS
jgi:predicted aspartyl protease